MKERNTSSVIRVAKGELENRFAKIHSKESIEEKIEELRTAPSDRKPTVCNDINRMFADYGIVCKGGMSAEEYEKTLKESAIPEEILLPGLYWSEMFSLFCSYKSPKEYMERIVTGLVDPEFSGGTSTRLKILQQFLKNTNYLKGTNYYSPEMKEIVSRKYAGKIEDIDEEIFTTYMKKRHSVPSYKELKCLITFYRDFIYHMNEVDKKLISFVREYDKDYPAGVDSREVCTYLLKNGCEKEAPMMISAPETIERIRDYLKDKGSQRKKEIESLHKMLNEAKKAKDSEGQKKLAKQLLCDTLEAGTPEEGDPLNSVSRYMEDLRKKHRDFTKEIENSRERSVGKLSELLNMCNELAEGILKPEAIMKERLYYFAIAFKMKVFTGDIEKYDKRWDLEKNLFEDYYNNNVLWYFSAEFVKSGGEKVEPSGIGVNPRSFVDIVYLYYINNNEVPVDEKIERAKDMIKAIVERYRRSKNKLEKGKFRNTNGKPYKAAFEIVNKPQMSTMRYRKKLFNRMAGAEKLTGEVYTADEVLGMTEEDLQEFLLLKYGIDERASRGNEEAFSFENDQTTATKHLEELRALTADEREFLASGKPEVGLALEQGMLDHFIGEDGEKAEFKSFLLRVDTKLKEMYKESTPVTRMRLIAAYYYSYIAEKESMEYVELGETGNEFTDFYNDFCKRINVILDEASYLMISSRNLFDMLVVFSAYIYLKSNY